MLPDPSFQRSARPRPRLGTPASQRDDPLDRPIPADSIAADLAKPFSRVAEAQGVTWAMIDRLVEQLPVGLMVVDRDGRVVFANAAARALRVDRLEALQWAVTRALLTEGTVREDEIEVISPGQPRRLLSVHVMPLRVVGLGVNTAFVMISDVTAKARMRAWDPVIESLVNL